MAKNKRLEAKKQAAAQLWNAQAQRAATTESGGERESAAQEKVAQAQAENAIPGSKPRANTAPAKTGNASSAGEGAQRGDAQGTASQDGQKVSQKASQKASPKTGKKIGKKARPTGAPQGGSRPRSASSQPARPRPASSQLSPAELERIRALHLGVKKERPQQTPTGRHFDLLTWIAVAGPFLVVAIVNLRLNGSGLAAYSPLISTLVAAYALYRFGVRMNRIAARIWVGVFLALLILGLFAGTGVPIWAYGLPAMALTLGMTIWLAIKIGLTVGRAKREALAQIKAEKAKQGKR